MNSTLIIHSGNNNFSLIFLTGYRNSETVVLVDRAESTLIGSLPRHPYLFARWTAHLFDRWLLIHLIMDLLRVLAGRPTRSLHLGFGVEDLYDPGKTFLTCSL